MHFPVQHALSPLMAVHALRWVVLLFFLLCRLSIAAAEASPVPQPSTSETAAATEELPPLTATQQEAQALASVLLGEQEPANAPASPTSLDLRGEQPLRPGKQLYIFLFSWLGLRVYLVSGQQTFVSPVDDATLVATDSRSTDLTRPHDATPEALAIGLRVE
jgi:hypothetical protein